MELDTLGSMRTEVLNWLMGDYAIPDKMRLVDAAINDYIEDIWMTMMPVQLARFFGQDSPVTFTLAAGQEQVKLVSIADPTVPIVASPVAGGNLGARTYYFVSYTYVTESGAETLPSANSYPGGVVVPANNLLQVTPPPNPGNAFGWNLYVGQVSPALQNQDPLPFNANFIEPPTGIQDYPASQQTPPLANTTADNISWITHMEIRTSDTLLRAWNQYDIDSELMRRYARQLSSASEYQSYVWDIINGNRLQFRPQAGLTFNPRYFYVAKPRRLRYTKAVVPYGEISGTHTFIVEKSVSKLKLGVDEYLASQAWDQRGEGTRARIVTSLTQELWAKNSRIVPHLF
jgi:hypothetical protein